MIDLIEAVLQTMRPKQWIKNLIIFAPLAFAQKLLDFDMAIRSIGAFIVFCLASSSVYLVNDILDKEADSHHPEKKNRPIASGRLSVTAAAVAAAAVLAASLAGALAIDLKILIIVAAYMALNAAYSAFLKKIVIVDAFCIAFGFILRMLAGAEALRSIDPNIVVSTWIVLCTLLGSLFLAFCKRRHELGLEEAAASHRASLEEYGIRFLDQMIAISTACTVMAYALWTMWQETIDKFGHGLFWTIPFVCYGIFRYLYLVHQKDLGGSPSKIFLSDVPLIVNILLWIGSVMGILYYKSLAG